MKTYIQQINIQNFKAFKKFSLKLEGRHLLLYGGNGSGKSSLYWALYTFLQSAHKTAEDSIEKYFHPESEKRLLNIHQNAESSPGEIKLTLHNENTGDDDTYRISAKHHGTYQKAEILRGDLASDFINYRFFFGFSNFRFSEESDLWPLFEKEILPFCVSEGGTTPVELWSEIKSGQPNPSGARGRAGRQAYDQFNEKVKAFANMLPGIIESINSEAQAFYDSHFFSDTLIFNLVINRSPATEKKPGKALRFIEPIIKLAVNEYGKAINQPYIYLNEARLTRITLSIRLAASLVGLSESDLKLLVLDDLLISLDMSNRMEVVKILLSDQFADYQKIILTHDLGFFREFQRMIGGDHIDWCFKRLAGDPMNGIEAENEKTPVQKAEDYLSGHDLEEAAVNLRKAAEDSVRQFRKVALGQATLPGEFHSLMESLREARNRLGRKISLKMYEGILKATPDEHRDKLVRMDDKDIDANGSLDRKTKGILKAQRKKLSRYLNKSGWQHLETIQILDEILSMTDRVLNPASHWGEPELHESEIKKAVELIKRFERHIGPLEDNQD